MTNTTIEYSTNTSPNFIQGFKRPESPAASLKAKEEESFIDSLQAMSLIKEVNHLDILFNILH